MIPPEDSVEERDPGTVWVYGEKLYYRSEEDSHIKLEGDGRTTALTDVGTMWIQNGNLFYVDDWGEERRLEAEALGSADGEPGSIWLEDQRLTFVDADGQKCRVPLPGGESGTGDDGNGSNDPDDGDAVADSVAIDSLSVQPLSVTAGETIQFDATLVNTGEAGSERVWLFVGERFVKPVDIQIDGYTERQFTHTVSTTWEDTGASFATLQLFESPAKERVPLSVAAGETALSLSFGPIRGAITHAATELDVPVTITNEGTTSVTADVEAQAGSGPASQTVTVPADGEVSAELTVPVEADPSEDLAVSARIVSDQVVDSVQTDVEVKPPFKQEVAGNNPGSEHADGLYRDITGDGSVGQSDVTEFFEIQHREAMKRPAYFDFSGNGKVGHGDVIDLFEFVATN